MQRHVPTHLNPDHNSLDHLQKIKSKARSQVLHVPTAAVVMNAKEM